MVRLCPTHIVIQDDYTKKSVIVKTDNKEQLAKVLIDKATDLNVSFHVAGSFLAGECENTITRLYDNVS